MDTVLQERVAALVGKVPVSSRRIERGYTPAERWVIQFADGSSAFAKVGATEATAEWLRAEHGVYTKLRADFVPQLLGFSDDPDRPLLLLEDLSKAHWPPPWSAGDVERLLAALARLAQTRPLPPRLLDQESDRARFAGWLQVERDPKAFLSLGLCSRDWLEAALPVLLMAQDLAVLSGGDLIHGDVRSDNVCFLPERVVFVDWNMARRGNAAFDLAGLAPSLRLEGGPLPEEIVPDEAPLAALLCGYFAANAGLPNIPNAPRVRRVQLRQLRIALPWTARALGLPAPDRPWAREGTARLAAELASGRIDEATWFEATEELLGDAYLAQSDPRAQSGKSGDEDEWRWSRELLLDALPLDAPLDARPSGAGPFHVLDIGCANGYLMESIARWGKEREIEVEPYGLDISWRLANLARRRLPSYAERIHVGNVLDWQPPRRYDLVHTALDYVPPARRRQSLERIAREMLTPKGRIVLRAERVQRDVPDLREQVTALGLEVGGVLERTHPHSRDVRRTVWLAP